MLKRPDSGAVLIVTLLLSAVIALFLTSAVQLLPTLGFSASNLENREQAFLAAQSGVDYARAQLQADPSWRGNGTGLVVDTPEFQVVEDAGNIFGFLSTPGGEKSFFRIRFNYQNGTDAPDELLDDPKRMIASEYVSFNNLRSAGRQEQYRAEPKGGTWTVTASSPIPQTVTKFTAAVIVEGFAGPGVSELNPEATDLNPQGRAYTRQVVEVYFTRPGFLNVDSAVMAAASLNAQMLNNGTMEVSSDEDASPPRVRALDKVEVYSNPGTANYVTPPGGEVIVDEGSDFFLNGMSSTAPDASHESPEEQAPHWLKLGFDQVTRATATDAQVRAGTYVWKTSGGSPQLEYFPTEYTGVVPTGTGTVISTGDDMLISGSDAIDLTSSNFRVRVKDNIFVQPQGGVTGFAIVSEPGLMAATARRPEINLNHSEESSVIFSNDSGSVHFEGKIDGGGAVTSAGDITFQGTSTLEVDTKMAVALYAKGDINLKAIPNEILPALISSLPPPAGGKGGGKGKGGKGKGKGGGFPKQGSGLSGSSFNDPQDVSFGGIIFAQGNFNVDLRQQDQAGSLSGNQHGSIYLKGILATFGGDPDVDDKPGTDSSKGALNLNVARAEFVYNPDYLDSIQNLDAPIRLDQSFWTNH